MYNYNDFLNESALQLDFIDLNLRRYNELLQNGQAAIENLEAQHADVLLRMAEMLAPDFSDEELRKVAKLLHKAELDLLDDKMRQEAYDSKKRLKEIEADPEYVQRESLVDENIGKYTQDLAQIKEGYKAFFVDFEPFVKVRKALETLLSENYGTPKYKHRGFWKYFNRRHLLNWKNSDIVCEKLGFEDFGALSLKYLSLRDQNAHFLEAIDHLNKKIQYIKNLESEKQEIEGRLPNLTGIYQRKLAKELEAFLASSSLDSISILLAAIEGLSRLGKIQQGLKHQLIYLREFQSGLEEEREDWKGKKSRLTTERTRYASNFRKYQGRTWPSQKFEKRFNRNTEWTEKRFDKYAKTQDRVANYRDYEKVTEPLPTIFWWNEFMGNPNVDGSFSPSVREYYETHTHDKEIIAGGRFEGREDDDNDGDHS